MKSISELLQDADPIRYEPSLSSEQRAYRRKVILAAASTSHNRAAVESRSRIALVVACALIALAVLFLAERMWSPRVSNVYAAVRFEVRLAEVEPAAGLREAKVSGTDRSVYLHAEVIVTNGDISRAYVIQVDHSTQYNVGVEFNPSGAEKIRAATAGHVGRPVAILLDGKVVMAATVREPIAESAVISGNLSKAEAEKIASGITPVR